MATIALVTFGVSIAQAQWPTTCVELNDLAEAAVGADQNVGIYQRAYGDQAEAQCQNDHRDDVRRTFAWALGGAGEAVAGTWPTSCVALNDLAEAARGDSGNVGIYQRASTDDAEAERACRSDHRANVSATFAWAIPADVPEATPEPVPEATPTPQSIPPTEHPDYQRVRNTAFARSGDADLSDAVASDVIGRMAQSTASSAERIRACNTGAGIARGEMRPVPWRLRRRLVHKPPQIDQGAQSQAPEILPEIRLRGLVGLLTVSIWDRSTIDLSNLDADQIYEVGVTSSGPSIVGIGDCLGASQWTTITGLTTRSLWFVVRGCTLGTATVTVEVRPRGADSAAASVSQQVTTDPIPSVPPHQQASVERAKQEVRDILAGGGPVWLVQRPYPPRLFGHVSSATATATTVNWVTWWATGPTRDVEISGFQMRYWPKNEPSRATTVEITGANVWQHRLTGLAPDTWYRITMRACTNQDDCSTAEWSYEYQFKTQPG